MRLFAAAALLFGLAVARADDKKSPDKPFNDAEFVKMAASGGMLEVDLGKLASTKATSADVRKFGERMVKDHGAANEDLRKAAKTANIPVPDKLIDEHQKVLDRFKDYKGTNFDKDYMNQMLKDHEEDVAEFTRATKEAKNPAIKDFATRTLPTIKEHLDLAKKLHKD